MKNLILLFSILMLNSCTSNDILFKNINNESDCSSKNGYWYKNKCWKNFEDDSITAANIEEVVVEQMKHIDNAVISINGTTNPIDFFILQPEGKNAIMIVQFQKRMHNLVVVSKMNDLEKQIPFTGEAVYMTGNLLDDSEDDEQLIAEGQLSIHPITENSFEVKGKLTNEQGNPYEVELILNEAVAGAGNSELEIKGAKAYLSGELGTKTYQQFKTMIGNHPEVKTIVFTQVPGSVNDAVNMHTGRLIRQAGLTTELLSDSEIASGGVDLFLAGKERIVKKGAKLGIHSWCCIGDKTAIELPKDHPAHQYQIAYFTEMLGQEKGVELYFYTLEAASFDNVHWMSNTEIMKWNLKTKEE